MSTNIFTQLDELLVSSTDDPSIKTPADVIRSHGTPTASIAILDAGTITTHCITSAADAADASTLFQACSISKPTAVICALRLIERGYFSLTTPIHTLLPRELLTHIAPPHSPNSTTLLHAITITHLLNHTAGLNVPSFPGYPPPSPSSSSTRPNPTAPSTILTAPPHSNTNTLPLSPRTPPGLEFAYSGGGTLLLQAIMEHATSTPFPDLMREHVFEPLGMTRSCYRLEEGEANVASAYYTGETACENRWHSMPEMAAAGLWTTAGDLCRLVRGVVGSLAVGAEEGGGGEKEKGKPLLKYETAKALLTRTVADIALGFFVDREGTGFWHSGGNWPGWTCLVVGYADLPWNRGESASSSGRMGAGKGSGAAGGGGNGIAIMTNSMSGLPVYYKLMHAIAYLKGWGGLPTEGDVKVPLRAPPLVAAQREAVEEWKGWMGEWDEGWLLREGEDGWPVAGIDENVLLKAVPAAVSPRRYACGEESVDLLLDGTEVMLRLGWAEQHDSNGEKKGGESRMESVLEVWNGLAATTKTLKRRAKVMV